MIFNINFFLFAFAQSNIWSYTFVYAKHYANVQTSTFGIFAMFLPTMALISKPMACSLADAHGIHKQILIGALLAFGCSYGSLAVIPFFKDPNDHDSDTFAWFIIGSLMILGYVATACIFSMNDTLASNYARKNNLNYSRMRIYSCAGYASGALLTMLVGEVSWLPTRVLGCSILFFTTILDVIILLLWPYKEDFEMFHDGSTAEQRKLSIVGPNVAALMAQRKPRGSISKDIMDKIKAGRSKSVGYAPRSDLPTNLSLKSEEPAKKKKEYTNFQCQMALIKLIAKEHKSFLRCILLFSVLGFTAASLWTFQLDYIKEKIAKDEDDFVFLSTLTMIVQSMLGDVLVFTVAGDLIRIFGSNASLSMALMTIGLRCFLYINVVPYLGVPALVFAEMLQGPSTGLYWILIADIGSNYALMVPDFIPELKKRGMVRDRQHEEELSGCLRATMIGIMSSSMEGLGVAVGTYLCGKVSSEYGYGLMWNVWASIAFITGFLNVSWDFWRKIITKSGYKKQKGNGQPAIPEIVVEDLESKKDECVKL